MKVAMQQGQPLAPPARMSIARLTWINVTKDLRLEWRSRDVFNSMMFFALVVVVVFSFSFEREDSRPVMGGLIWIAFLFSTTMALNQSWARELRNGVLDAYRVSPAPAEALFLGKVLGNFILIMLLECLMAPLFVVFYNLSSVGPLWQLLLIALLGTWALVVNGTFFAAMSIRTRNRELMLPLLLLPISLPAVISMVTGTTQVLSGEGSPAVQLKFLAGFCVIFTTACFLLFDTVLNAE
ncbi:MAG TPA: heme exporter protein CcmB [Candidatus Polarisedimenticolia bacterium]|jgi:heme exporter protein B|nr:heme exporter protein CcmB [Candidatus Polarisedimenticolia bacterium]